MLSMLGHHTARRPARQSPGRFAAVTLAACAVFLAACATPSAPSAPAPVWITNAKSVRLLPPSALGRPLEWYQQIQGEYGGQSWVMDTIVTADPAAFSLIALNGFGTQVFEMTYDASGMRYSSGLPLGGFKPEYLMADWQTCFYPAEAVAAMYAAAGLEFSADAEDRVRTVSDGGELVIRVERSPGETRLENRLRGYRYRIIDAPQ